MAKATAIAAMLMLVKVIPLGKNRPEVKCRSHPKTNLNGNQCGVYVAPYMILL
jgi:hypothetical protein